jgi:hypothetical protein
VAAPGVRTFFCRSCRAGVTATDPPDGWWRVQQRVDEDARRNGMTYTTRGVFCGLGCLLAWAADVDAEGTGERARAGGGPDAGGR